MPLQRLPALNNESLYHAPVWNPGIHKLLTIDSKTLFLIESYGRNLRMQVNLRTLLLAGKIKQCREHGRADPLPPVLLQHRHPTNVSVGFYPAGTDRAITRSSHQHVVTGGIQPVPFKRFRDMLLLDEYRTPDGIECRTALLPAGMYEIELLMHKNCQ